ncbi:MAG: Crp/Fnr family transcriptional regulator [Terriglobales bacterium]
MNSPNRAAGGYANRLLAVLDAAGRKRFASEMDRVALKTGQVLYSPDQRISDIYFPEDSVIAMLTVMESGATVESATVGREGASWISASFKSPTMPCQTIVTIAGDAYKVPAEIVESEIRDNGIFHNTLSHYSHVLLIQTLRSTACNALHTIEQRCARWMLMTLDRTDVDRFAITHDFLSNLLGVRRATVSQLVEQLAEKGVLQIKRGWIRVADRQKLEAVSCECYQIVKNQFDKVIGP